MRISFTSLLFWIPSLTLDLLHVDETTFASFQERVKEKYLLRIAHLKMLSFYPHIYLLVWLSIEFSEIIILQNFKDLAVE